MVKGSNKAADRLAKLEEQRARINAEIQRVRAREQQQERKNETRRKVLVGAMILAKVNSSEWPEDRLMAAMYIPFAAVAIGAGAPPLMVAVCFAIFSNFMWGITEYAGGPGPIYFGQGFFERPRFYKINFILVTVSVLIVFTIGMLWWKLIGLY